MTTAPHPRLALALGVGITAAGITHFTNPGFFDDIVERIPAPGLDDLLHTYIDAKLEKTLD